MPKYGVNLLLWADKFDRETVDLIPKVAEMGSMVSKFQSSTTQLLIYRSRSGVKRH